MSEKYLSAKQVCGFMSGSSSGIVEDSYLSNKERGIFTLADGFGGTAGKQAAEKGCKAVVEFLEREAGDADATLPFVIKKNFTLAGNIVFNALVHANHLLIRENEPKGLNERGGCSLIGGYLDKNILALAGLGVCSGWLYRGFGEAAQQVQLLKPRSYQLFDDPFSEDLTYPIPLGALGVDQELEPEIIECKIESGDWLVLANGAVPKAFQEQLLGVRRRQWVPQISEDIIEEIGRTVKKRTLYSVVLASF